MNEGGGICLTRGQLIEKDVLLENSGLTANPLLAMLGVYHCTL